VGLEDTRSRFITAAARAVDNTEWLSKLDPHDLPDLQRWGDLAHLVLLHNREAGLTAITDADEMAAKHFIDSLSPLLLPGWPNACSAVDVGSGAGFPGLVLAMAKPSIRFVLVEANAKKARFLEQACRHLGVEAEVLHVRAEDYGQGDGRERFDVGLARAAAALPVSLEYVLPLVRVGGGFVAQVGPDDGRKLEHLFEEIPDKRETPWAALGGALGGVARADLPSELGVRYVAWFAKRSSTPARYPRRAGLPSRAPLPGF